MSCSDETCKCKSSFKVEYQDASGTVELEGFEEEEEEFQYLTAREAHDLVLTETVRRSSAMDQVMEAVVEAAMAGAWETTVELYTYTPDTLAELLEDLPELGYTDITTDLNEVGGIVLRISWESGKA